MDSWALLVSCTSIGVVLDGGASSLSGGALVVVASLGAGSKRVVWIATSIWIVPGLAIDACSM